MSAFQAFSIVTMEVPEWQGGVPVMNDGHMVLLHDRIGDAVPPATSGCKAVVSGIHLDCVVIQDLHMPLSYLLADVGRLGAPVTQILASGTGEVLGRGLLPQEPREGSL